jgi:predicted transposase/invertase (TIGR01784 family)
MSTKLHKVHDAFVKNLLSHKESAVSFLKEAIPVELYRQLEIEHLTFIPNSYVSNELAEYISDLVFKIPVYGTSGALTVSVLIEHKSRVDHLTCIQLLKYITNGYVYQNQKREKFSVIIPIIYYHGKRKWKFRHLDELFTDVPDAFKKYIPVFAIEMFRVQEMSIPDIHAIDEAKLRAALLVQKGMYDTMVAIDDYASIINALQPYIRGNFFKTFFVYLSQVITFDENTLTEITNQLTTEMKTGTLSLYDNLIAKGRQEGRQEGIGLGIEQGSLKRSFEFARRLVLRNVPLEEICELTDLTMEQVLVIKNQIKEGK